MRRPPPPAENKHSCALSFRSRVSLLSIHARRPSAGTLPKESEPRLLRVRDRMFHGEHLTAVALQCDELFHDEHRVGESTGGATYDFAGTTSTNRHDADKLHHGQTHVLLEISIGNSGKRHGGGRFDRPGARQERRPAMGDSTDLVDVSAGLATSDAWGRSRLHSRIPLQASPRDAGREQHTTTTTAS